METRESNVVVDGIYILRHDRVREKKCAQKNERATFGRKLAGTRAHIRVLLFSSNRVYSTTYQ